MKNLRKPLGTVAALVALATTAHASMVISSFSNVALPGNQSVPVDIDGDLTTDFSVDLVEGVNSSFLEIDPAGSNLIATNSGDLRFYSLGDTVAASDPNLSANLTTGNITSANFYVGVSFSQNSQMNTAWMEFNFDSLGTGTLVNAAWQNVPGQDATIAAVPEPAVTGLAAGLMAGWLAWRRRRNRHGLSD